MGIDITRCLFTAKAQRTQRFFKESGVEAVEKVWVNREDREDHEELEWGCGALMPLQ